MPKIVRNNKYNWIHKDKAWSKTVKSGFYQSVAWRSLRNKYYANNPLCAECNRQGITNVGRDVDHIKPFNKFRPYTDPLALDWNNLQTLCVEHHKKKTAKEAGKSNKK